MTMTIVTTLTSIATIVAKAVRGPLEHLGQYGMSPDGCSAAARKQQLVADDITTFVDAHGGESRLADWTHQMGALKNALRSADQP